MPLIAAKRDGGELERDDLFFLLSPVVSDEQLAAFLMAVVWHGMTERETEALLDAMIASGTRLTWPWPVADKHSTGGVGDKATLVVAPLVAACGGRMAKMSGRGLGHTGGTLDKLESISGFRTSLSVDEMREQVERVGVAVCGQTADLAPADARLYALRDMTATTHSLPLIATSVMSKKIASGASRLVLDVKAGEGAFMPDRRRAEELGALMARLGDSHGIETTALVSAMDEPLGHAVGNALEVAEAVETLRGGGPPDLRALAVEEAAVLTGDRGAVELALDDGSAYETYRSWVRAQGGDPDAPLPCAPLVVDVRAPRATTVRRCHAYRVADLAMRLGAGRQVKGAEVDHAVGLVVHRKAGDRVDVGDVLATVHSRGPVKERFVVGCFSFEDDA
ncbi:MAG TPA: thymidine phosphorylase [Gaiellales bacterium]|nr:thymidine phosphorylase [Gaiellales bacterium]